MNIKLSSLAGATIIRFLGKSLRIEEINSETWKKNKKVIFAFWHGEQFIPFFIHRNQNITVMASLSKDGEIQSAILSSLRYKPARGSSSKGGDKALVEMIRTVKKGSSAGFAIDGPRGPIYEVKKGVLYLSQKTGCPIVIISSCASLFKIFHKAWDKYEFPVPFSRAVIAYGRPFTVPKEADLEKTACFLKKQLDDLSLFTHKYYWSKDINVYLKKHPSPKILIINLKNKNFYFLSEVKRLRNIYSDVSVVLITDSATDLKFEEKNFFDEIIIIDTKNIFPGYLKDLYNFLYNKKFDLCLKINNSFKEKIIGLISHSKFVMTFRNSFEI